MDNSVSETKPGLVDASEIRWTSSPIPCLELLPVDELIALDFADLLEYAGSLQEELRSVRDVLREATAALARVSVQRDRAIHLVQVLRGARATRIAA